MDIRIIDGIIGNWSLVSVSRSLQACLWGRGKGGRQGGREEKSMRRPEVLVRRLPQSLSTYFLRQDLSRNLEHANLARPAG